MSSSSTWSILRTAVQPRFRAVVCGLVLAAPLAGSAAGAPPPAVPAFRLFPRPKGRPDPVDDPQQSPQGRLEHRLRDALREDAADFKSTARLVLLRPWRDLKRRPLVGAAVAGTLFYTSAHKRGIREEVQEDRLLENDRGLLGGSSRFGQWQIPAAAALAVYLGGLTSHKPGLRDTGRLVAETMLFTGMATTLGQSVLAEDRPASGGRLHFFGGIGHGVSGHASASVALTYPLVRRYLTVAPGDGRWKRAGKRAGQVVGYSIPFLTGLSRVRDDKHFLWNVLAGWGIGYYVSDTVWKAHARGPHGEGERASSWVPRGVAPYVDPQGGGGVELSWSF